MTRSVLTRTYTRSFNTRCQGRLPSSNLALEEGSLIQRVSTTALRVRLAVNRLRELGQSLNLKLKKRSIYAAIQKCWKKYVPASCSKIDFLVWFCNPVDAIVHCRPMSILVEIILLHSHSIASIRILQLFVLSPIFHRSDPLCGFEYWSDCEGAGKVYEEEAEAEGGGLRSDSSLSPT
jgi:hypothetical protein